MSCSGNQPEDPSSTSRSSFDDLRQVRFDPILKVQSIPLASEAKENLWWQEAELKRVLLDSEKLIQNYQNQADACSWRLIRNKKQRSDELCGVLKSTKLLFIAKRPTEKAAMQLTACLNRAPDLRSLERRLLPQYKAAVWQHVRSICNAQYQQNPTELANRASNSSRGSVLFGQALARHDFAQANHPDF